MPVRVGNHTQEIRALIRAGRKCPISIDSDDFITVCGGKGFALPDLTFNGLFTLPIGGVACVDYRIFVIKISLLWYAEKGADAV